MERVSCLNDKNLEKKKILIFFFKIPDSQKQNPKRGVNQVPQKLNSPIAFYKSLQSRLAMDLINTPMPRVSCPNDENPENHFVKKCPKLIGLVLRIFIISTTNP